MIRGAAQHTFGHELNGLKAAHILAIRGRYLVSAGAEVFTHLLQASAAAQLRPMK